MSRRPANVTQASVARALRAVKQVGYDASVMIDPDGTIRIVPIEVTGRPSTERSQGLDEPRRRIKL
jgi:hypothetical protein